MSGAKRIIDYLSMKGVTHIFGYPGGAILPVLNELYGHRIKYILSRTEQGAGFMADGYAKITGKPGVVMTTSGPGALNIVTCLQNALSDGTPLLALSGQVSTNVLGTDAFQETDIIRISKPCTKWNCMIREVDEIENVMDMSFDKMTSERYGPVLIDLPKNKMSEVGSKGYTKIHVRPVPLKNTIDCSGITKLIMESKRPVILAGQGVYQAGPDAIRNLRLLSKIYNIPVTTTLMGLGVYDEKESLSLKMMGMHGSYYANMSVHHCDLLLNIGSRFDDRITGNVLKFAPFSKIVHIDISAKNINKIIKTPYYMNESCGPILQELVHYSTPLYRSEWMETIRRWKKTSFKWTSKEKIQGKEVISILNEIIYSSQEKFTIVADVGAHQMWTAQFIDYNYPRIKMITSGGLGCMGYALPSSIGVKMVDESNVICICGDGGFTMSMVELLTAIENQIDIKVIIINNSYQLMVKTWQDKFYHKRHIGVKMNNPSFEEVCRSMGCMSIKIEKGDDIKSKLTYALYYKGPIVANVITDDSESILPMVLPEKSLNEMIIEETESIIGEQPC